MRKLPPLPSKEDSEIEEYLDMTDLVQEGLGKEKAMHELTMAIPKDGGWDEIGPLHDSALVRAPLIQGLLAVHLFERIKVALCGCPQGENCWRAPVRLPVDFPEDS